MLFDVVHVTTYRYDRPVGLGPHIVRQTPRTDASQRLLAFGCSVTPQPVLQSGTLDAEGNLVTRLWFDCTTSVLQITCSSRTETRLSNPFDYLIDAEATGLPVRYGPDDAQVLATCLGSGTPASSVSQLAAQLAGQAGQHSLEFLAALNRYLYHEIKREIRHRGAPQEPAYTLLRRAGACRDLAVLFIAVCRCQGIAARFVSGYQAHAENPSGRRHLHAWVEVYIPGGGWRGYDPSHGTAVTDDHVAVAASCNSNGTMPVCGSYYGTAVGSRMEFDLTIRTRDDAG